MLTNEIRDLIYSYIPIKLNQNITIVAQATSQSSEEFQTYANIMLNAGVDPNSPYSAISFDTLMLAALGCSTRRTIILKRRSIKKFS